MSKLKGITKIKTETLVFIQSAVTKSCEDEIMVIPIDDFIRDKVKVAAAIEKEFKGKRILIRSTDKEDAGGVFSKTGHYKSLFNIKSDNKDEVIQSIKQVIDYSIEGFYTSERIDEVIDKRIAVFGWKDDIDIIGSVYTRDAIYNRPYYVINYFENDADKEQSDNFANIKWVAKNVSREFVDEKFYKIIKAVKEVEQIYDDYEALEIEFYMDKKGNITIL